jgi:hypothetical protein
MSIGNNMIKEDCTYCLVDTLLKFLTKQQSNPLFLHLEHGFGALIRASHAILACRQAVQDFGFPTISSVSNADRNDSTQFTFLEIRIPQHLVNDVLSLFAADCFQAACSRECSVRGTCD